MTYPNKADYPDGLYSGTRAITSQSYIEANVKNGTQFEYSSYNSSLAGSGTKNTILLTGANPVIIKARTIQFTGLGVNAQVFEGATYSGGTSASIFNLSRITPTAALASIITGATVSDQGTPISAITYGIGGSASGDSIVVNAFTAEVERVLKPNTAYLLQINNIDTSACKVAIYTTFYEGFPDLPTTN